MSTGDLIVFGLAFLYLLVVPWRLYDGRDRTETWRVQATCIVWLLGALLAAALVVLPTPWLGPDDPKTLAYLFERYPDLLRTLSAVLVFVVLENEFADGIRSVAERPAVASRIDADRAASLAPLLGFTLATAGAITNAVLESPFNPTIRAFLLGFMWWAYRIGHREPAV